MSSLNCYFVIKYGAHCHSLWWIIERIKDHFHTFIQISRLFAFLLRTMKLLWETRVSPNVVYSMQHMATDTSALVVGGVDGVLRIINQGTVKTLAWYVLEKNSTTRSFLPDDKISLIKRSVKISEEVEIGHLPMYSLPPISSLAVGWKKVVTCHNGRFIRLWRFNT